MTLRVQEGSLPFHILLSIFNIGDLLEMATAHPSKWARWERYGPPENCRLAFYRLVKSGFLEIVERGDRKYAGLTPEGKIQILMLKARTPKPLKWDGKWRVVFFDIPEDHKVERHQLRRLLLKNEYRKMQASVYISPWPLNREAVRYLQETGLINYIRIGRLEELDNDDDLKKKFHLV